MANKNIKNKIFLFKIDKLKIKSSSFKKMFEVLSTEEINKFYEFKDKQSAKRYIASKYLTRKVISDLTNSEPKKIKFKTNKFGRPSLVFPVIKNFDFNLSHSGNWVALAIADCRIGIDIEEIRSIDLSVVNDFFHKEEIKFVYSKKGKELHNFYKIWTLKESFIKAVGKGLSYPLKNFYFNLKGGKIKLISKSKKDWYFRMYYLDKNYRLALCFKKVKHFSVIKLIKLL